MYILGRSPLVWPSSREVSGAFAPFLHFIQSARVCGPTSLVAPAVHPCSFGKLAHNWYRPALPSGAVGEVPACPWPGPPCLGPVTLFLSPIEFRPKVLPFAAQAAYVMPSDLVCGIREQCPTGTLLPSSGAITRRWTAAFSWLAQPCVGHPPCSSIASSQTASNLSRYPARPASIEAGPAGTHRLVPVDGRSMAPARLRLSVGCASVRSGSSADFALRICLCRHLLLQQRPGSLWTGFAPISRPLGPTDRRIGLD